MTLNPQNKLGDGVTVPYPDQPGEADTSGWRRHERDAEHPRDWSAAGALVGRRHTVDEAVAILDRNEAAREADVATQAERLGAAGVLP